MPQTVFVAKRQKRRVPSKRSRVRCPPQSVFSFVIRDNQMRRELMECRSRRKFMSLDSEIDNEALIQGSSIQEPRKWKNRTQSQISQSNLDELPYHFVNNTHLTKFPLVFGIHHNQRTNSST
jgi:hypothetical protein